MTARHHPGDDLLLGYAAGDLAEPMALVIATHLALCPVCRAHVRQGEALGGALLDAIETEERAIGAGEIDAVLARAGTLDRALPATAIESGGAPILSQPPILPNPLRDYLGGDLNRVAWQALGPGIRHKVVARNRDGVTARLLRIAPRRAVFQHGHRGTELTLVLQGSYAAGGAQFARGDLEVADQATDHRPIAGTEAVCICLAVTDAPLNFHNPIGRLMQPFLGI